MLESFLQDLKYALRQLVKNSGFTAITVLILALGIGANTAIFSMVNGVLLRPVPYEGGDRLVLVRQQMPAAGVEDLSFSPPEVADYRQQSRTLENLVEYHSMWFTLLGGEEPQRVQTGVVSADFFEALGVEPVLGRSFHPDDEELDAEPVLILSHGYWQREFGGDPGIVGRTFEMNDRVHTVVGVLPPLPKYPEEDHMYMPVSACPFRSSERVRTNRESRMVDVFGRLRPGVTLEQARTDVALVADRLLAEYPEVYAEGEGYAAKVEPLEEELIGEARPTLLILLGTVALVLLVTCVNLASLTFAQLVRREKELAVRSALGAGQGRLTRLLLSESLVLAIGGGALGLLLAVGVRDLLIAFAGRFTTRADEIAIDATVLLFTLGVALATGLAIGSLPAFYSRKDLFASLREGGSPARTSAGLKRLRNSLLVVELAISFILLIGAGLMVRSLFKLQRVDAGFMSDNVLTLQISLNWSKYGEQQDGRDFFSRLLERVATLPGVVSSSISANVPLDRSTAMSSGFEIEGESYAENRPRPLSDVRVTSPGYFKTVGIPLLSGRDFAPTDDAETSGVAIINRSLARHYWGEQESLGKRISFDDGSSWQTIVGIVGDVRHDGLDRQAPKEIYLLFRQFPVLQMNLLMRTVGDPMQLVPSVREAVREIDPEQPLSRIRSLDQVHRKALDSPRFTASLLGLFAGLALTIAAAGLGGLIANSVSQQTQEIGVRMALGAGRGQLLWTVVRGAMALVLVGLAAGGVGAWFLTRLMSSLLFGIEPNDLVTFLVVSLLLAAVAVVACLLPARRAILIDPVAALRCE